MAAHSAAAQPPLKVLFQKWVAIGVLTSAVNNPHAAVGAPQAITNEFFELTTGLENPQSMQVQVGLHCKMPHPERSDPTLPARIGRPFHILPTDQKIDWKPAVDEIGQEFQPFILI